MRDDVRRSDTRGVILKAALWISLWLMLFAAGCGSDEPTPAADASPATTAATTETSPGSVGESAIVGRWQRVHKCGELLNALDKAGLREVAPRIVGEEYFPDVPAAELAQKDELCEGAKSPFVHSHFFDGVGRFGSLDENENQVDEGRYDVIDRRTIRIGGDHGVEFSYEIEGDTLTLSPVLTQAMVEEARTNPLVISDAARAVAVAYPGHAWKRVGCKSWC